MKLRNCSMPAALALSMLAAQSRAQVQSNAVLSLGEVPALNAVRGQTAQETLTFYLRSGFHVNSNKPNDEYLIPLRLTWNKSPLEVEQIVYPEPRTEHSDFSEKPLSVYSGTFHIVTKFRTPAAAATGSTVITGKLRYQACNNRECLQPRTIDIQVPGGVR